MQKIKNSIAFLLFIIALGLAANIYFALHKITYPSFLLAAINIFIFIRLLKVAKKKFLVWLNGPKRFCKGKGIEIGSCGRPMIKGSMLVDLINNFANQNSYKVDYAADAHELPEIDDASMDYVCASHVLEHLTNPIKATLEWLRILRPGGIIWLKIPDKRKTFDRKRGRTALAHLIEDFKNKVPLDDPTHIGDFNKNADPPNSEGHPYVHNHVWVPDDMLELFNYINKNHQPLTIIACRDNSMKYSQDFWVVIIKSG